MSFEMNKMIGAILGSILVILGIQNLGETLYANHGPETPAYSIEIEGDGASAVVEVEAEIDIAALLAEGNADSGKKVAKKCAACHTFDNGGAKKIGPNLYNIIGKAKASADFGYSSVLQGLGGEWTYQDLLAFLENPKGFAKGTKMSFGGIKKPKQRADLIAFLRTMADSPPPLPE